MRDVRRSGDAGTRRSGPGTPAHRHTGTPAHRHTGTPAHRHTGTPYASLPRARGGSVTGRPAPRRRAFPAALLALAAVLAGALLPDRPAQAQTTVWSATLTADISGVSFGCDNEFADWDNCSSSTVLTDDDFVYGGTTYTVAALFWNSSTNTLRLSFSGVTGAAAKTALTGLTLNVGGTALAVSSATTLDASAPPLSWSYDPATDWVDGTTVSLSLTAPASDTTGPTVSTIAVTSNPPSGQGGYYKAGDDIAVTLTFNEGIVVTGTPALAITVGSAAKSASCARQGSSGDAAKKLVCTYSVTSGDADANGISVAANKLTLPSGATIKDSSTNDATRTHSAVTTQSAHKVDAVAPAAPRGFTASAEVGRVRLTWSAPSPADASIAKWQVRQKTTGSYGSWSDVAGGASARSRLVTGLVSGTAYTFQLRAVDTATNAGPSATAGPATPTAAVSTAPVGQTVAADWSLIPKDTNNNPLFTAGQRFRLLFVTSGRATATSTAISTYNGFVQNAANSNTALRPFKSQFRAVISTSTV